jgi:hypothetical protein
MKKLLQSSVFAIALLALSVAAFPPIALWAETLIAPVEISPIIIGGSIANANITGGTFTQSASSILVTGSVTAGGNVTASGTIAGSNLSGTNTGDQSVALTSMLWVAKNGNDANSCSIAYPCLTVAHAISVASAGTTVMVMPGNYTENITLVAGVSLQGQQARSSFITGNMVASYSGTVYLHSLDLQASSGNVLAISGTNATNLQIDDTHIDGLSGAGNTVSYTNSNAASKFNADNGVITAAVTTSANAINASGAGSIYFEDITISALDNIDHVAVAVAGAVTFTHYRDQVNGQVTTAGTGYYLGNTNVMNTSSVPAIVANSSGTSGCELCAFSTSAHPLITGAGTFVQGFDIFTGTGYDFANTLTGGLGALPTPAAGFQLHAETLLPAGGLATGLLDGMLEHDASHLYVDIGTTRYQLDQQSGSGSVTSVSGVNANGFNFTVANPTTAATITATTTVTGILKGNGTAISAASTQGNTTTVQVSSGVAVSGDCVKFDANGNTVDAGAACGTGGGGTAALTVSAVASTDNAAYYIMGADVASAPGNVTPAYVTSVSFNPSTGTLSASGVIANGQTVGYLGIPINSQSANYLTVAGDAGYSILRPSTDTGARTFTIAAASSVNYAVGTAISFENMSTSAVSIAISGVDVMYLGGTGTTGTRSLATYGTATAHKIDTNHWIITGAGLTFITLSRRRRRNCPAMVARRARRGFDNFLDRFDQSGRNRA